MNSGRKSLLKQRWEAGGDKIVVFNEFLLVTFLTSYHVTRQATEDNGFLDCDAMASSRILIEPVNRAIALRRVVSCRDCQVLLGVR